MSGEVLLKQEAGVRSYKSAAPVMVMGYELGSLLLTNRRLVFIPKGKWATFAAGPLFQAEFEKMASKSDLEDFSKYEGSYSISLEEISNVAIEHKFGGRHLRVDHPNLQPPAHSYIFGRGFGVSEDLVQTLKSTIAARSSTQPAPITPQAETECKFCIECGDRIRSEAKFCPKCGGKQS